MTLEELLAPVDGDAAVGADLAYDGERQLIEQAFDAAGRGDTDVDWRETVTRIEEQSRRTKDVWLAVYLARGGARLGQLDTVETGCRMLAGLFDLYWDDVHPTLADYGMQGRKGPCESLTRIGEFLGPLRRVVLLDHPRLGSYTGEDFERFARDGDGVEGYGLFRAALADAPADALRIAVDRLDAIRAAIARADQVLTEQSAGTGDTGTNFQATYAAIDAVRRAVARLAGLTDEAAPESEPTPIEASTTPVPSQPRETAGRVDSREDVVRTLDTVIAYYERREPSSPIPLALRRVKGWTAMDFMSILKDISPGGVSDAGAVLLTRAAEESSWS